MVIFSFSPIMEKTEVLFGCIFKFKGLDIDGFGYQ